VCCVVCCLTAGAEAEGSTERLWKVLYGRSELFRTCTAVVLRERGVECYLCVITVFVRDVCTTLVLA
jgi:hypothetical protein